MINISKNNSDKPRQNCQLFFATTCFLSKSMNAENIERWYTLEAVLTSIHNLCIGAKIRKIGIPLYTPVLQYKSGVQWGMHYSDMFS